MIHFLELPEFDGTTTQANHLHRWLSWLKYRGREDEMIKYALKDDPVLLKADREYQKFTADEQLRELYEAREKANKDYNSGIADAYEKGLEHAARRMLDEGFSIEMINKITGLSREEIEQLRSS